MMPVKRIELARGTTFYPHARRVLWDEDSAHPTMSWPLPETPEEHALVHHLALNSDPETRRALFSVLAVASAYAQMTMRDPATKRNHVCAMLRKASREDSR